MDTKERCGQDDLHSGKEGKKKKDTQKTLLKDPFFRKRFHTICHFASGGMGVISKAKDLAFDRIVAVKSLREEYKNDPEHQEAFLRECRFHAQLDHPSIVPIYAMGISDQGTLSLAMKFIRGISMKEFILEEREKCRKNPRTGTGVNYRRRLEYFLRIAEAVAYCHSMQIIHGDLKPENILLGSFGELYVMDWGCARSKGSSPRHAAGTLNYLPPEFLQEKVATSLVDIFALGMILFELASLRRAKNTHAKKEKTLLSIYDRKSYFFYHGKTPLSPRLKAVILKAVDPLPSRRYQTVEELIKDVRGVLFNGKVEAYRESFREKSLRCLRNHAFLSLAGAFLLIFLLSCGWFLTLLHHSSKEERSREETLRQARLLTSIHLLSLPVSRELLRAKAKLLLLADHAVLSREKMLRKRQESQTAYPDPEELEKLFRKAERYEIYFSDTGGEKSPWKDPALLPPSIVKSMGIIWEDGTLVRSKSGKSRIRHLLPPPFPDLPGRIHWGGSSYLVERGKYFSLCHTPLYGKEDRFYGLCFQELDLQELFAPLMRFKNRNPDCSLYFIPGRGKILQLEAEAPALLEEEAEAPLKRGRLIRELLRELAGRERMFFKSSPDGISCYTAGARIPAAGASLLLVIEEKKLRKRRKKASGGERNSENSFSFQIF